VIAAACLLLFGGGRADGDEPARQLRPPSAPVASASEPRVNLFLEGRHTIDDVIKSLAEPDFVLLGGDEFRKLLDRGEKNGDVKPGEAVVDSVAVTGTLAGDRADLSVEFGVTLRSPGPAWVPIRLDEKTVVGAYEGTRDLPLRSTGEGWQLELRGIGTHLVRVEFRTRLRVTLEGHRLDVAIPEAASTRFAFEVAERVSEAVTSSGELVEVQAAHEAGRARLSAHLTPRSRLDVSWRVEAEPGLQLPPLLTLQGEIAIDIDPGSFRTRSTWSVHAVRGTTQSLELRLDPADEVLELEFDGQSVPAGIERNDGSTLLTIALHDPLRPGQPKALVMTTRRAISTARSAVITFGGFALTNAKEQSGAIGIAQNGNLWIEGLPGRGLRRIDPRTELPPDLRARPATALAYVFADQPFELILRVDPSSPLVRAEAETTITLDARQARVDTWLEYQPAQGRLFDLSVGLPAGLMLESAGPADVVEASQRDGAATGDGAVRVVTLRLTPVAQEAGTFRIHLAGRQDIDPGRPVDLALFQPLDATSGGGRIAVLTDRNVTASMRAEDGQGTRPITAGAFRDAAREAPSNWPWPDDRAPATTPSLWLRYDGRPANLALAVAVHPRALSYRTNLRVSVDRRNQVIDQETACTVHFGTLDHLDVEVPSGWRGRWEILGSEVASRSNLGDTEQGDERIRLTMSREVRDTARLRFRFRRPLPSLAGPGRAVDLEIPRVRPVEGEGSTVQVEVRAEPGIELDPRGAGWSLGEVDDAVAATDEAGPPPRFLLVSDGGDDMPPRLSVRLQPLAELPALIASRLWLRTVQGLEDDLRTTAVYLVEAHGPSFDVSLPPGATWVRAKMGGTAVAQVEQLFPKSAGYRLLFPERAGTEPIVVELEFTVAHSSSSVPWLAPQLADGFVQQTLWEVEMPWGRAVVGIPAGWTDQNTWTWDRYHFRRRPWQTTAALAAWAGIAPEESAATDGTNDPASGAGQDLLFGRPGPPRPLPLRIASRGWLVGTCSGSVLAIGAFLILLRPSSPRLAGGAALALLFALATIVEPSVTLLLVQSSMIGFVLTLMTALIQRLINRRRPARLFGDPGNLTGAVAAGSTVNRTIGVGSDDSTQIRTRPASSTVDHHGPIASSAPPEHESASGRGPRAG
jgi:hypothetical protein